MSLTNNACAVLAGGYHAASESVPSYPNIYQALRACRVLQLQGKRTDLVRPRRGVWVVKVMVKEVAV